MRRGNLIHPLRHCEERFMRRGNLIHPPRHCEERFMRRGNLIHPLRHCEERFMRRGNLILYSFYEEKNLKMRSSRLQKTKPQDDQRYPPRRKRHCTRRGIV
jgi:hypothetical protein